MNQRRLIAWTIFVFVALIVLAQCVSASSRFDLKGQPFDTLYEQTGIKRVYCDVKGSRGLMVPMVGLDTNAYPLKFWLSEKQLISPPTLGSQTPSIAVSDQAVLANYSVYDHPNWIVYQSYSDNRCLDWFSPGVVQGAGIGMSGNPVVMTRDSTFYQANASRIVTDDITQYIIWRRTADSAIAWGDSTEVFVHEGSSGGINHPVPICDSDSLYVSFKYVMGVDYYFINMKSGDDGLTWTLIGDTLGPGSGAFHRLLVADSVFVLTHSPETQVGIWRSLDRGVTWDENTIISSDGYSGQAPASATPGDSVIHVIWYDFESGSSGWGGVPYYRRSVDCGATWEPAQALCSLYYCEKLDIWADSSRVYAVWNDSRAGSPDFAMYMRISHDQGVTWSPEFEVVDQIDPARDPDVIGDGDYLYFAWQEQHPPDWVWGVYIRYGAWYVPGDVDMSGEIDIVDLIFLVNYMFNGGHQPWILGTCDMDGNGAGPDIADLVYLVQYMFNGGPAPVGAPQPWE